jgi:dihydrofolate synthase / folylpolyglutamate synthase
MTYERTLEYLFSMLPMYQRVGKVAYKKDLTNTLRLLESLDNPEKRFKSIHIAGTNGKGTSAHGIAAILQSAGYKTGLYTSPHLKSFTERIRLNGEEVSKEFVVQFVEKIAPLIVEIKPSFFEVTVAMAFQYFAHQKVDIAVIETGLGGRLDSTNVISPEVSLITNIGLDHTDMLGDTLEKIAFEKAGIIKDKTPIVIGEYQLETYPVFEKKAKEVNASLTLAQEYNWHIHRPNTPDYLKKNLNGVLTVIDQLRNLDWIISDDHIAHGLFNINELTGLKGRYEIVNETPLIIADVSHNAEGLKMLFDQVCSLCMERESDLHLIFGTVKDKSLKSIFNLFPKNAKIYWTQSSVPRSLPVDELANYGMQNNFNAKQYLSVNDAIADAKNHASLQDVILITGSTFVVAEIDFK